MTSAHRLVDRFRHQAGQTLVLFAIMIPLFLALGAIAVDVGYWFVVRKTAQDAADAAALAAARELTSCDDPGCPAYEVAKDYVLVNMDDASFEVETPYTPTDGPGAGTPDPAKVEVTVTHPAASFFGRAFGIFDVTVSRRAVAQMSESKGNMAIFSHSEDCESGGSLEFNGEDLYINGLVHSNGQFRVDGGPFWAADGTLNRPNCPSSVDSDVDFAQFGEDHPPPWGTACAGSPCREPRDDFFQNWPTWYTPAEFGWTIGCTYKGETIEVTPTLLKIKDQPDIPHGGTAPSGTYCATKSFHINGDNISGTITALSPDLKVDGNNQTLSPFARNVLFFTVPNNDLIPTNDGSQASGGNPTCLPNPAVEMQLNGNSHTWAGTIFSPCGRVLVNVSGSSVGSPALVGTIVAKKVKVNGPDFFMVGEDDFSGNILLNLVE